MLVSGLLRLLRRAAGTGNICWALSLLYFNLLLLYSRLPELYVNEQV